MGVAPRDAEAKVLFFTALTLFLDKRGMNVSRVTNQVVIEAEAQQESGYSCALCTTLPSLAVACFVKGLVAFISNFLDSCERRK